MNISTILQGYLLIINLQNLCHKHRIVWEDAGASGMQYAVLFCSALDKLNVQF